MSIPGSAEPLLLPQQDTGYKIERSIRFNSADSAYCSRTFSTPTTQGTFTFSAWVKRAILGSTQQLLGVSTNHSFGFTSGDALNLTFGGTSATTTTAVFRDPGAWYHIVWTQSGTSHTLYVNNVSVATATATSSVFNTAVAHQICAANSTNYFNGYLADVHFIDGQALTPSSFGETDINGVWQPKAYSGSYGTNGFKLAFADNSAATATTLGKDTSGNGNNWTPNNLSVTAGAGNDSLVDTPTSYGTDTGAGGEVRGNYATLNPLDVTERYTVGNSSITDGNLMIAAGTGSWVTYSTFPVPSTGKWYFEGTCIIRSAGTNSGYLGAGNTLYSEDGNRYRGSWASYGASYGANDIIGVALNADSSEITFYKNGVSQGVITGASGGTVQMGGAGATYIANFGQRPFAYTAPSGFKCLVDTNLPAPLVAKPNSVFDVALWTGNGSARSITGLNFNPDFVWIKGRSGATDHALYDAVRGATIDLVSNSTAAETTQTQGLTAFNSDGFSLGTLAKVNTNTATYAGWAWDAGSSTVTNTQGSITSQVRANASAGFSVVTYTGNGTGGATVGHGLGVKPFFRIIKRRDTASTIGWITFHESAPTSYFTLNTTNAATAAGEPAPTATVFSLPSDANSNASGGTYVAYCFAPVAGYSAFGSYTGNGSADGPFVYTGFRPRWLMVKQTNTARAWLLIDAARSDTNVADDLLLPNSAGAEFSNNADNRVDFLSNGFKLRGIDAVMNQSAGTYIYCAFAESPLQYARAR